MIRDFWDIMGSTWNWEPSVLVGCEGLLLAYVWLQRFKPNLRWLWFLIGDLLLLLSLISPMDRLGDQYLFTAHMLQHLLMVLIVPIFLLLGLPPRLLEKGFQRWPWLGRIERILGRPAVAWLIGIGTMTLWHIPALYNAALGSQPIHIAQHLSFIISAVIFWWPILTPLKERRVRSLPGILYLFLAGVSSSLLGVILTFTPASSYPTYVNPLDSLNLLETIRLGWQLDPGLDRQIGGILMWVLGGLVYTGASLGMLARWYAESEREESPSPVINGPIGEF